MLGPIFSQVRPRAYDLIIEAKAGSDQAMQYISRRGDQTVLFRLNDDRQSTLELHCETARSENLPGRIAGALGINFFGYRPRHKDLIRQRQQKGFLSDMRQHN